jgi:hypothetical protein
MRETKTAPYKSDDFDKKLLGSIRTWRLNQVIKFNGGEYDPDDHWGPFSFMPDNTMQRLVDLAHHDAFASNEQLIRDVDWFSIDEHAEALRSIMQNSRPRPVPPPVVPHTAPCDPLTATTLASSMPKVKRTQRCSECHEVGHNSM